ncbi:MAG: heme ABC exporter ATP-binding protein CcmA [Rhodobacteraceae bacterium]|nr:heme ABC exporter ATP-binding protein CcmA [Paracoccaceae bacterium]MBR9822947.1 heme ABC exporter ATP-binding protein CcmA [Paracoccaceae bacterium]
MDMRVTDLSIARGGVPLLEGVSFALVPGQALILRGPNGSGKTTLLRTLAGLQPALAGTLTFDSESVAYGAHADGLKAQMTVAENLTFWAAVHGGADIAPALAAFDLQALRDRLAGALSAGQKRRLGLARLMVTGRALWLLDEPTVSLDAGSVALFAAAVRRHLAGGGMAVIATHIDLGLPEAAVLDLGPLKAALPQADDFDGAFL